MSFPLALEPTVGDIAKCRTLDYHLYKERNKAYIHVHVHVHMYAHIFAWVRITLTSGKIHEKLHIVIAR